MYHDKNSGLLAVSGAGAAQLLQGQLSCDVLKASAQQPLFGAHCNAQGRVLSLFRLFHENDTFYLVLPRTMIAIAQQALAKYAPFYKVQLQDMSDNTALLTRWVQTTKQQDIEQGMPMVYPETSGFFLPHDLNLQQLQAIDFNKGCFTGQEIIARMQYRAKLKKQMYRVHLSSDSVPAPGTALYCGDADTSHHCGEVVDACQAAAHDVMALIVTDNAHARNQHIYLQHDPNNYFQF